MKSWTLFLMVLIFGLPAISSKAARKPTKAVGWGYAADGPIEILERPRLGAKVLAKLGRGALVPVYGEQEKSGKRWLEVITSKPQTGESTSAWVEASRLARLEANRFPADEELLKLVGGPYLEDIVGSETTISRYLLQRGSRGPVMVCLFESPGLANVRLELFMPGQNGLSPGRFLEFPNAGFEAPVGEIEMRDVFGDGDECLISREPFSLGVEDQGVNLVVRRIEGGGFKTLWKEPVEFVNLASFASERRKLDPPEKNLGAPGTVTHATVEFASSGGKPEILWKAQIEFHVLGRDKPVETITAEKHCAWDGSRFEPVD